MTDVTPLHGCKCESGESFAALVRCGKPGTRQVVGRDGEPSWLCDDCARILRVDENLLGQQVRVKLDENVLVEGRLLTYGDSGEFTVEDDGGFVHHCWPILSIERAGMSHEKGGR